MNKIPRYLIAFLFNERIPPHISLTYPFWYKGGINITINTGYAKEEIEKIKDGNFIVDKVFLLSNEDPKAMWKVERIFGLKT